MKSEISLLEALKAGDYESVISLINAGADVNTVGERGITPLLWTAINEHTEVARVLLDRGADVNQAGERGITPLLGAAISGSTEVAKLLLGRGAGVNQAGERGITPLLWTAINGHTGVARVLLDRGAYVNKADKDGRTPLLGAAMNGRSEVAKLLLDRGADVNKADEWGMTPLLWGAMRGQREIVKLFLKYGAPINNADIEQAEDTLKPILEQEKYLQDLIKFLDSTLSFSETNLESLAQEFTNEDGETIKIANGQLQGKGPAISLVELCSNEFAANTIKGMIFTKAISRQVALEFVKKVEDFSKETLPTLVELEKDLSFDTAGLVDDFKLLMIKDLIDGNEAAAGDRAHYYENLIFSYGTAEMTEAELKAQYPHPLDTPQAQKFFEDTSEEDQITEIAHHLVNRPDLVKITREAIEKGVLTSENKSFYQKVLVAYEKSMAEAAKSTHAAAAAMPLVEYCDDDEMPDIDQPREEPSGNFEG
jgi:ankyrin repeat protein